MNDMNNVNDESARTQKRVLEAILGSGMKFYIAYTTKTRQRGFFGFFKPKVKGEKKEEFTIKEPTLSVLDRASLVWLRMNTESIEREDADIAKESFKFAQQHAKDMAECLAILVLGEAYEVEGDDELKRLTELFYKTIKPSQCMEIALYINSACNLADFVGSTRLMKMSLTTTPTARVE